MKINTSLILCLLSVFVTICADKNDSNQNKAESHGKSAKPNYSTVFPKNKVNRIDIVIDAEKWIAMQTDLNANVGAFPNGMPPKTEMRLADRNTGQPIQFAGPAHPPGINPQLPGNNPEHQTANNNIRLSKENRRSGPPPGIPGGDEFEPVSVSCDIFFNEQKWSKVGLRYKGNSSLRSTCQQGIKKLSFKLDFDQFEDEYPEIENQRFYGFKQLNLKNNYDDKSFIREKVAAELFAEFGLVTPKTAFYQVFVDYGDGPQYFGLYTMVEEVDDTVIETGFTSENGNLYKPEGRAATFASGSFRITDMNKKTNRKSNDYSDIEQLSTVLNSSLRLENYELWKSELNEIFDVPVFLKWLAVNTVIQNWDTYGSSIHNYYLYNNPASHKLVWIPWDYNEAFQKGKMRGAPSLSFDEIDENWPLIRYILNDVVWNAEYKRNVTEFSGKYFTPDKMYKIYSDYYLLLSDYIIGEQGEKTNYTFLENSSDFAEAIYFLKQQVFDRKIVVEEFLSK